MALLNNARTALELPEIDGLPTPVKRVLNDRFRTIAQRIDSLTTGSSTSTTITATSPTPAAAVTTYFAIAPVKSAAAAISLASANMAFMVALTVPVTAIANPTNIPTGGAQFSLIIEQDAVGSRQFTLGSSYLTALAKLGVTAANFETLENSPGSQFIFTFASDPNGNLTLLYTNPPTLIATP